jgi:hypothetical protein
MNKSLFKKVIATNVVVSMSVIASPPPAVADDTVRYKSTQGQIIKKNTWTTLNFNGKTTIKGNGKRSLFCYQVALEMKGKKKPKYVKVRFTRVKPGKNDTTATNIYPVTSKPGKEWVGSQCWTITTKYPVAVQVRITGGSNVYVSDVRQFKMWTPGADYPADFSDMMPQEIKIG